MFSGEVMMKFGVKGLGSVIFTLPFFFFAPLLLLLFVVRFDMRKWFFLCAGFWSSHPDCVESISHQPIAYYALIIACRLYVVHLTLSTCFVSWRAAGTHQPIAKDLLLDLSHRLYQLLHGKIYTKIQWMGWIWIFASPASPFSLACLGAWFSPLPEPEGKHANNKERSCTKPMELP